MKVQLALFGKGILNPTQSRKWAMKKAHYFVDRLLPPIGAIAGQGCCYGFRPSRT
jgi:hypothetical protein